MNYLRVIFFSAAILANVALSHAQPVYEYDYSFDNPIIDAADTGNEYEVSRLLKSGASPNSKGLFNTTALMRASLKGHESITRSLLESGADVHAKDIGGTTALHFASRAGNRKIAELLLRYGASPDVLDNEGYTPLKRAVMAQHPTIVEILIDKGADLDSKGNSGTSARDLIGSSRNPQINSLLKTEAKKSLEQHPLLSVPNEEVTITPLDKPAGDDKTSHTTNEIKPLTPIKDKIVQDKESFTPKSEVKVEEAIKVSDDTDLKSSEVKIQPVPAEEKPAIAQQKNEAPPATKAIRKMSMEIGGFDTEEKAILFWQDITEKKLVDKKNAKLVVDNTSTITKYRIRFDGYTSSNEVFDNCKKIKSSKMESLCYVIHNIY